VLEGPFARGRLHSRLFSQSIACSEPSSLAVASPTKIKRTYRAKRLKEGSLTPSESCGSITGLLRKRSFFWVNHLFSLLTQNFAHEVLGVQVVVLFPLYFNPQAACHICVWVYHPRLEFTGCHSWQWVRGLFVTWTWQNFASVMLL
jgi:hypothetical protein